MAGRLVNLEVGLWDLGEDVLARNVEAKARRHRVHSSPKVHEELARDVVGSEEVEDRDAN